MSNSQDSKIIRLADRGGHCGTISPLDLLKDLVRDIEEGREPHPEKIIILMTVTHANKSWDILHRRAGLSMLEEIGVLQLGISRKIEELKGKT